jgi:hypothetical protein
MLPTGRALRKSGASLSSEMSLDLVIIKSTGFQDSAQVRPREHDCAIEIFAPNLSDEPLCAAILPR